MNQHHYGTRSNRAERIDKLTILTMLIAGYVILLLAVMNQGNEQVSTISLFAIYAPFVAANSLINTYLDQKYKLPLREYFAQLSAPKSSVFA